MAFRVTGAYEDRTRVEIDLPYDKNGDPAFDPAGKPIKGAEPVRLVLPRYMYMPREQLQTLIRDSAEIEKRELTDDYNVFDRQRDSILASIRPVVDADTYQLLERLEIGELAEINTEWQTKSGESLGESSASAGSSTSMRRR